MPNLNMDPHNYPNATAPIRRFTVPSGMMDAPLEVGEMGKVTMDVKVVGQIEGAWELEVLGEVTAEGNFRKESANDMRKRLMAEQEDDEEVED